MVEELKSGIYTHNNQFVVQWVTILTLLVGVMVPTHHTTTPYFLVTTYTIYSALAVLILGLLSVGLNNNNLTPHLSLNSFLLVCLGAILPLLNNIILIYLFFEIIVYLVLYLVLVQTQVVNENQSVVKSTIWLFIINFVSSITLFYGIYSYICSGHYQTTVSFLNQAGTPI